MKQMDKEVLSQAPIFVPKKDTNNVKSANLFNSQIFHKNKEPLALIEKFVR